MTDSPIHLGWRARPIVAAIGIALPIVALDQWLKTWLIDRLLDPFRIISLTGWMDLTPVWNHGVSFGLFTGATDLNAYIFSLLALTVIAGLLHWLGNNRRLMVLIGIGLITGGAIGNAIDRLRYGAVFDYLHLYAAGWSFWVFNLADAAISGGVGFLVLDGLRRQPDSRHRSAAPLSDAPSSGDSP